MDWTKANMSEKDSVTHLKVDGLQKVWDEGYNLLQEMKKPTDSLENIERRLLQWGKDFQ